MKFLALPLLSLVLAGCAAGPDFRQPQDPLQGKASWDGTGSGLLGPQSADREWWNQFGDATLRSLIAEVREANLDVKAAEAQIRQSRAAVAVQVSGFFPRPQAEGQWEKYQQSSNFNQGLPMQEGGLFRGSADALWELDVFGRVRRQVEAASANSRAARLDREDVLALVSAEVGCRYIELRGAQAGLRVARENVRTFEEIVSLNETLLAAGQITNIQLDQSRANLDLARSTVPVQEAAAETAANRIAILLGRPPGYRRDELLKPAPFPAMPSRVNGGIPSDVLVRRPDVRVALERVAAASASIGVAQADLFPRFYFNGSIRVDAASFSSLFAPGAGGYSFGPAISWTGLDFWRVLAQVREARARNDELLAVYEKTVLEAAGEVSNQLVTWTRQMERAAMLDQAVANSRTAASLARSRYERGLEDFLTVLQAELTRINAETQAVNGQTEARLALIGLYRALGGGWNG